MQRFVIPTFIVLAVMALIGVAPLTQTRVTDAAVLAAASPTPVCSPAEIAKGNAAPYLPPGSNEGIIRPAAPAATPTDFHPTITHEDPESLYIAVLTLPPDSCIDFRKRSGAVILFVQQGTVVYTSAPAADRNVVIVRGDSDGNNADNQTIAVGETVTLNAGEWITQDRPVWYSFRNAGGDNAIISAAVYAVVGWDDERCTGGCRKP
ncbi:MAG: hypothetical protein U0031_06450 [Thermomicrobiales bacterium]